ncbi:hypothetical protein B7993_03605 [Fibrobacter sp. UWH3]|nr:hypothetical protein B7993_03605 [Fibrobacter sp. UWH3]
MVACDDSVSSANNENADKESSSSVISEDASSSSVKPGSSSSDKIDSSSSVKPSSSSSDLDVKPGSSSSKNDDPKSSSSRGLFDVTKDEFLNPEITYGTMTDKRDNKTYKTVKIGDQVWMAENLNYADSTKMPSLKGKSWCYENAADSCAKYGRLYTWAAAIDSVALANDADNPQTCGYGKTCTLPTVVQGVCPSGWHLPTYDEWQTLFKAVGGSSAAGKALKSGSGWSGNGNGTDAYGFSALPAGNRSYNGYFNYAGSYALFWSASQYENYSDCAYYMYLGYSLEDAYMGYYDKDYGNSVRCLQNSN